MYGTHVYNINRNLDDTRARFRRIIWFLILIAIAMFIGRQLIDIPILFMNGLARNVMSGDFSHTRSLSQVFLENDFVQTVVVFCTGLVTVFVTFFKELRQLFFPK